MTLVAYDVGHLIGFVAVPFSKVSVTYKTDRVSNAIRQQQYSSLMKTIGETYAGQ